MIIVLDKLIDEKAIDDLVDFIVSKGCSFTKTKSDNRSVLLITENQSMLSYLELEAFPIVEKIVRIENEYQKVSSKNNPIKIVVKDTIIGRDSFSFIAGPCTIEDYQQLKDTADFIKSKGLKFLRGGAFKLRTSPYSFPGLGIKGIEYMKRVCEETGLISVSEIICVEHIDLMSQNIDILQVGTRNMHNYRLLSRLGKIKNPIILKRGMASTIEEWLLAAEHIINSGNPNVILCERGIRTFENYTRNTLDLSAIPAVKKLSNLPIIIDPSHSTGKREMIKSMSWAAIAAGADGLIIEVHPSPNKAICDSRQTINYQMLDSILEPLNSLLTLWNKN